MTKYPRNDERLNSLMSFSSIYLIFRKELLEAFRDRKTIVFMILLPILLYPLLGIGFFQIALIQANKVKDQMARIVFLGDPPPKHFLELLEEEGPFETVTPEKPAEALQRREIQAIVEFPKRYAKTLNSEGQIQVHIRYDDADEQSTDVHRRLLRALEHFRLDILWKRLENRGLTKEFLNPITEESQMTASPERRAGSHLGRFLPYLILLMIVNGTMYPAIDITAGEKERGTLECLLVSPPSPTEIILAKFCTVFFFGILSAILNLASLGLTAASIFKSIQSLDAPNLFMFSISWETMGLTAILLIPFTILFAAALVTIASFADSFKEAQTYITPLFIIIVLPALVSALPGTELTGFWMVVPVTNLCLLMKELFLQQATLDQMFFVFACSSAYAGAALSLAVRLFSSEEVLFPREQSFALFRSLRASRRALLSSTHSRPQLSVSDTLLAYAVVFPLAFYVGSIVATNTPLVSFILNQYGVILGIPVFIVLFARIDFRRAFLLRMPHPMSLLATLLMVVGSYFLVHEYLLLQEEWLPIPKEMTTSFIKIFKEASGGNLAVLLLLGAVSPAICEEALFRGFMLGGLRSRFSKWQCLILSALFFGLLHMSIHRFIPTTLLGLVLAWLAWETKSLLPGMIFHFLNNAFSLILLHFSDYGALGETMEKMIQEESIGHWSAYFLQLHSGPFSWTVTLMALVLLALGGWMVSKARE